MRDGGGDVLVLTTAYMKRDKNVTNFTLPMPSDDTLASIKDFHIAWKIDDGDVQESRLPVDLDVWESLRDAKDRERMFLAALNKLFGSDFKVFKDDVILVFQKHDSSIVDKIEFVHPEGLKVSTLRDLQISLKGFKNGSFYNKVMSISVKKYEFNCLEEYK
ncbi:MAG: hypothetical protein E7Y34_02845, partial [Mycoplasma sp.]|nr:hypothetical protein [Mycoplasma sp.]